MISKTKSGLTVETQDQIVAVLRKYPQIEKCVLYGSRAQGTFKTGSDIDLTIFSRTLDFSTLVRIQNEIDDLLLPYKVDLSHFQKIDHQNLIDHINEVGLDFYLGSKVVNA